MANKDVTLKDEEDNDIYPVTKIGNIYDNNSNNLNDILALVVKMLTSSSGTANEILTFLNSNTAKSSGVKIENQQIVKPADSVMWWQGRDNALLRQLEYLGFCALMSLKTTNGDWSLGTYSDDTLNINYTPDTDHTNGTNNTRKKHVFGKYETGNGYVLTEYACSKSGNGYFKFNNGLIVQWGRTASTNNTTISYPTSFSSATSYSCAGTSNGWSGSYGNYGMSNLSKTGFYYNADKSYVWLWVAIGY